MNTKKMLQSAMLIAIGTLASHLIVIPVGVARCYPIQHTINVIGAVLLGPGYAVVNALIISLLRNILGVGSILAFPGSVFGALFAGLIFRLTGKEIAAGAGEVVGTGILGGFVAFPMAKIFLGSENAALFFIPPFVISSLGGAILGIVIIKALKKSSRGGL